MDPGQIILYQIQGGETRIEIRLTYEAVRLPDDQMSELFQFKQILAIAFHIGMK